MPEEILIGDLGDTKSHTGVSGDQRTSRVYKTLTPLRIRETLGRALYNRSTIELCKTRRG